jgi:arabinofuranosyltransferase
LGKRRPTPSPESRRSIGRLGLGFLLLAFVVVLVRTAWLCDDAYISLRTVDNFVHGHGLRWNPDERVQAYTHPLWILVVAAAVAVTHEIYLTTIVLSIALSLAAVGLVTWGRERPFLAAATGLVVCMLSPSFVSYSTSGLENPLSFLLLAAFLVVYSRPPTPAPRRPFWLGLLAGLALVNRLDLVWLYAPPLALELYRQRHRVAAGRMALGFLPLVAWSIFSLVYYGFLLPNPALGKLNTGIGVATYVRQGIAYFADILVRDPLTFLTVVAGVAIGLLGARGAGGTRAAARPLHSSTFGFGAGILLYLVYLVAVGGDFMRGRFLTVPFLLSVGLLVRHAPLWRSKARVAVPALAVLLGCLVPNPTLVSGPGYGLAADGNEYRRTSGIADERAVYFRHYGLLNGKPLKDKPGHDMERMRALRARDATRIRLVQAAGRSGFIAGSGPHLVDSWGLVDPLTARLHVAPGTPWRIGHGMRNIPAGYLETLLTGTDKMQDTQLREYAAALAHITREPLFGSARWREIVRMNLGRGDRRLRGYTSYPVLDGAECARLCADPTVAGPELLWKAAVHHIEQGDRPGAAAVLRRLFELPADYKYGIVLPDVVAETARLAVEAYGRGQSDFAMDLVRLVMELAPERPEPPYALGLMQLHSGQVTGAVTLLEEAARKGSGPAVETLKRLRQSGTPPANR